MMVIVSRTTILRFYLVVVVDRFFKEHFPDNKMRVVNFGDSLLWAAGCLLKFAGCVLLIKFV
jgi:hypothetical protein